MAVSRGRRMPQVMGTEDDSFGLVRVEGEADRDGLCAVFVCVVLPGDGERCAKIRKCQRVAG